MCYSPCVFSEKKRTVSVIVTSGVRKPEPDFRGILFQGLSLILFHFFPLTTTLCPGEIEHTNN